MNYCLFLSLYGHLPYTLNVTDYIVSQKSINIFKAIGNWNGTNVGPWELAY